jgi:sec-independent protein translocase protein TatA
MGAGHIWILLILAVVALLIFGPDRLPEIGRNVGKALAAFKGAVSGDDDPDGGGNTP